MKAADLKPCPGSSAVPTLPASSHWNRRSAAFAKSGGFPHEAASRLNFRGASSPFPVTHPRALDSRLTFSVVLKGPAAPWRQGDPSGRSGAV